LPAARRNLRERFGLLLDALLVQHMRATRCLRRRRNAVLVESGLLQRIVRARKWNDDPHLPRRMQARGGRLPAGERLLLFCVQRGQLRRNRVSSGGNRLHGERPVLFQRVRHLERQQVRTGSRCHVPSFGGGLHLRGWQSVLRRLRQQQSALRPRARALPRDRDAVLGGGGLLPWNVLG
jgi:hypothetical protein